MNKYEQEELSHNMVCFHNPNERNGYKIGGKTPML